MGDTAVVQRVVDPDPAPIMRLYANMEVPAVLHMRARRILAHAETQSQRPYALEWEGGQQRNAE